jgi:hypothetical protein
MSQLNLNRIMRQAHQSHRHGNEFQDKLTRAIDMEMHSKIVSKSRTTKDATSIL